MVTLIATTNGTPPNPVPQRRRCRRRGMGERFLWEDESCSGERDTPRGEPVASNSQNQRKDVTFWQRGRSLLPRRGADKSAQGRAEQRQLRSAALGRESIGNRSPVRATQGMTIRLRCFALTGLWLATPSRPRAALRSYRCSALPWADLFGPLRGRRTSPRCHEAGPSI